MSVRRPCTSATQCQSHPGRGNLSVEVPRQTSRTIFILTCLLDLRLRPRTTSTINHDTDERGGFCFSRRSDFDFPDLRQSILNQSIVIVGTLPVPPAIAPRPCHLELGPVATYLFILTIPRIYLYLARCRSPSA